MGGGWREQVGVVDGALHDFEKEEHDLAFEIL